MGAFVLHIPENKLRVVAPDVGGGFGSQDLPLRRGSHRHLGRRQAAPAGEVDRRAQRKLHVRRARPRPRQHRGDGAGRGRQVPGAARHARWPTWAPTCPPSRPCIPTYLYATLLAGVYKTPAIYCEVKAVFTNTVPVDAYRGAGRPEATYLLERLVDVIAHDTGIDPVGTAPQELHSRRRLPLPDAGGAAIRQRRLPGDAGRRAAGRRLRRLRSPPRRRRARAASCAASASPPTSRPAASRPPRVVGSLGARAGLYEVANIRVHPTGSVTVFTGTHSHGQGHETTFAQLVCRPARRADGPGGGRARRHREDPVRHGHLRQPQPRGRRLAPW